MLVYFYTYIILAEGQEGMYYRDFTVPLPKSGKQGTIHILKTGYVYLATSYKWDKDNRKPIEKRITIGKIVETNQDSIYPNQNYESFFGPIDRRAFELKKFFSSKERREANKFDVRLSCGAYYVLRAACQSTGCYDALKRTYSKSVADTVLAIVVHSIVHQSSCAQDFTSWCFDNYCGLERVLNDSEISRCYKTLGSDYGLIKVFFNLYREEYEKNNPKQGNDMVIAFDSTNQNTYAKNLPYASLGKAKIDLKLPIINTAMFVDEQTGIPMWYEHYDGSILDKSQTPFSLKKIVDMGFKKIFAMFDRGYYSEAMIREIRNMEWLDFGILCPENVNWVDELIDTHGKEIKDCQNFYVPDENVYANRYEINLFDRQCYAYLFYDAPRAADEHTSIHEVVKYYWRKANERKMYSEKMEKEFAGKGIIVQKLEHKNASSKNFELFEDTAMIQRLLDRAGYFVMISDKQMFPAKAISYVRKRDKVEKSFEAIKRHFNLSVTYTHSMETYSGKMFVAFIAAIVYATILNKFKNILSVDSSRTIAVIMSELNKYKIEQKSDSSWIPAYAMSKLQKQILNEVNLTEKDLFNEIRTIKMLV